MDELDREIAKVARESITMMNSLRDTNARIESLLRLVKSRHKGGAQTVSASWVLAELKYIQLAVKESGIEFTN